MENEDKSRIIPKTAAQFEKLVNGILGASFDVVLTRFSTNYGEVAILFIDGLVNRDLVDRDIIGPLKSKDYEGKIENSINAVFSYADDIQTAIDKALEGNAIVFTDNIEKAFVIEFKQWDKRTVEPPDSESVTRGPKEGFTESIQSNTSLIRRKLRTPNLVIEQMKLGKQSNTVIAIVYLEDIVNQKVLKEVKKRLETINVDSILETGQIEQYLEEKPHALISAIGTTQKPDVCAAKILEGRVAIMCDGTPHVLTIPYLFVESMQNSEDYYIRTNYANFLRMLRFIALIISVFLPGLAIAILTFSQEMIPFVFLNSFITATEKTPLSEASEVFLLVLMFELIKEASLRLPKSIGSALTIVGALIIGDAAVNAGIVGAPTVIIVALTAVSGLLIPNLNEFTTVYRFIFLFFGAFMGLIGIGAGMVLLFAHVAATDSFGIPVLSSYNTKDSTDGMIRFNLIKHTKRPSVIAKNNKTRINFKAWWRND
jgi:spore germination protein KA